MLPVCEIIANELKFKLLTMAEQESGIGIQHDFDILMDADIVTKANASRTMIMSGTMTPNEGAKWLGNEKINSEFGDLHFVQQQNQPIEFYDKWPKSQINTNQQNQQQNGN